MDETMNQKCLKIGSNMTEVEIWTEQIELLANDLNQGYFDQNISNDDDLWKIGGQFYDKARIRTDIILSMIYDVKKATEEINFDLAELCKSIQNIEDREDKNEPGRVSKRNK